MTDAAQQALRRLMELYSSTTRFAFACNLSTKIIEPLQSRCAILRFTRLSDKQILKRLKEVAQAENVTRWFAFYVRSSAPAQVTMTDDGLHALIFTAEGDMRQAINNLQSTFYGFKLVTQENVFKVP